MSRTREHSQAFKVAQIQSKRADRADERLAEVRRETGRLRLDVIDLEAQLHATATQRDELRTELEATQGFWAAAQQGWNLEQLRRREDAERPLWRIASQRLRTWLEARCR